MWFSDIHEGEASLVRADLHGRGFFREDFRVGEHVELSYVLASDRGEEATSTRGGPSLPQAAAEKGLYLFSLSAAATCISCARVATPISWSIIAKPPSQGSISVMKFFFSVQAAGPQHRRRVSFRERSAGTRLLHSFWESSNRASSAPSSWSQLSLTVRGATGSARAARSCRGSGARRFGYPAPGRPAPGHWRARLGWTHDLPRQRLPELCRLVVVPP